MISILPSLAPIGIPQGVDPRTWRQAIEKRLNDLLDQSLALITALDCMEVDCDLEDNGDAEAWLGWPDTRGPSQLAAPSLLGEPGALNDDRELDFADYESTALETAGRGFRYSGPDDSEDEGDSEAGGDAEPDQHGETVQWSERTDIPQEGPRWHFHGIG